MKKAEQGERIAFELCRQPEEAGLSLALSGTEVYYIAAEGFLTEDYLLSRLEQVVEKVPFCAVSDVKKILKYIGPKNRRHLFDIEIAAYLVNPLMSSYAHEDLGKPYAALTTWKKVPGLVEKLEKMGMKRLFEEIEMPLVFTLYDMERAGIRVNGDALKAYGDALIGRIEELERQIHTAAGEAFNINSPK